MWLRFHITFKKIEVHWQISIKYANFFLDVPITEKSVGDITGHSGPLDQTYEAMAISLKLMLNFKMAISDGLSSCAILP